MTESSNKSRKRTRVILALVIGAIVFAVPVFFCGILAMVGGNRPSVDSGSILVLEISGSIQEAPSPNPFAGVFGPRQSPSIYDLRRLTPRIADDDRIKGVLLVIEPVSMGMGTIEEASQILSSIRAGGKPVYAVVNADFMDEGEYLLAANAEQIWINPQAGLLINGFEAQVSFYRGTLDKLKIKPEAFGFKEYKSASETFTRHKMSDAFRESLDYVLTDMYERFLDTVAEKRSIDRAEFERLVDKGGLTPQEGLDAHLVDHLGYLDEALDALVTASGAKVTDGKPNTISFGKWAKAVDPSGGQQVAGDRIAVVYGLGPIVSSGKGSPFEEGVFHGPEVAKAIDKAARDDKVKAIVFRVDSPGGSAVGSDYVWRAIQRAKEKKPVIVSMGAVAGSGGYWVSMGADVIVAQPSTITGSIGVVFTHFNLRGFYNWIGVEMDSIKKGKKADLFSSMRDLTPSDAATIKGWMEVVYNEFVRKVAEGRGMTPEKVEEIAKGRIWTGVQGKDRGLVDEIGGLDVALKIARDRAKVPESTPMQIYPRQKNFLELLSEGALNVGATEPDMDLNAVVKFVEREYGVARPMAIMPEPIIR